MGGNARASGDRALLDAVTAVLAADGLLVVAGPPGAGVSTALAAAVRHAEAQGIGLAVADDVQDGDPAALPTDRPAAVGLRLGVPAADPAGLAAAIAGARTVTLGPLDAAEVAAVLRGAGVADPDGLAPGTLWATGGNPWLVQVVARHALEPDVTAAVLDADPATLPAGLVATVAAYWSAHLARLGPGATGLVDAFHVLAPDAPLWLAADLAGLDPAGAAATADALVRARLLAGAEPLRPGLPLALAALRAASGEAVRANLHRRAARRLAQTRDGSEAAATHLLRVPAGGDPGAAGILRDAARTAVADGRHGDAVVVLERALEEPLDTGLRIELLLELGEACVHADAAAAVDAFEAALRLTDDSDRAPVHLRLGRARYSAGDYRGAGLELERGLAVVSEPDGALAVELIAAYVAAARFDRDLEDAAARHLAPLLDRDEPGRTAAERALLGELALERGIRGFPRDEVIGLALRAWGNGLLLEGADPYGIALSSVAAALTWSDAFADSERVLGATIVFAEREGNARLAATAHYLRCWPRWYTGQLAAAEADVRAALGAPGWEMYEPSARAVLGHVLIEQGRREEARAALVLEHPEAWATTVPYAMLLETRARLHVGTGDLAAAATDLAEAGALLESMGNASPFCSWRSALGTVRAQLGDVEAARELIAVELTQASVIGTPRAIGTALRARAALDRAAGGDGLADLERAVQLLEGCGARTALARTQLDLGVATAASGRREAARAILRSAHTLALELGAHDVAEPAGFELRRAGGRPRPVAGPGGLTAAELRVARLAAAGRTNREIATALVLSPHTVRYHLAGVYRKLGVDRRDGIVTALAAAAGA